MDGTETGSELTAWEEVTGVRPPLPSVARSTQVSLSSRMGSLTDLVPVSRAEFAAELVPCLALTSGVGMSATDQRAWLNAAYKALDGIPIALLKRGAIAAMEKADHPSKIVPAIMAEVRETWAWRRNNATAPRPLALPAPVETEEERAERLEVAALMGGLAKRLAANASK